MQHSTLRLLRHLARGTRPTCTTCHQHLRRAASAATAAATPKQQAGGAPVSGSHASSGRVSRAPAYQPAVAEEDLRKGVLKPLGRPLGFEAPPRPGENSPEDDRTWRQRRDDFVDYEKHLEKRRAM